MRMWELRQKEVINCCNCKRLGYVADMEFDICKGCIHAIIVLGPGKICGLFGNEREFVIPYSCIKQIGPDIILVEINEEASNKSRV